MIIQYCIDWGAIRDWVGEDADRVELTCSEFISLERFVRQNGCLIQTGYIMKSLTDWLNASGNKPKLSSVLTAFKALYIDQGMNIDEDETANSLSSTMSRWEIVAKFCDLPGSFKHGDRRCIFVTQGGEQSQSFFCTCGIGNVKGVVKNLVGEWTSMQCIPSMYADGELSDATARFARYLYSFSASASKDVRLVDKYLWHAFEEEGMAAQTWSDSIIYFIRYFAENPRVENIDIITTKGDLAKWYFDRIFCRMRQEGHFSHRSTNLNIVVHIINGDSDPGCFHDRFVSNGRAFFSIGHGLDVGRYRGDRFRINCFNLYFGCLKCNQKRSGITIFEKKYYPSGCSQREVCVRDGQVLVDGVEVRFNNDNDREGVIARLNSNKECKWPVRRRFVNGHLMSVNILINPRDTDSENDDF